MSYGQRIPIKTRREIESMREAARHVAEILIELRDAAKPGVTTRDLDRLAAKQIDQRGVESSFLGYAPGGEMPSP